MGKARVGWRLAALVAVCAAFGVASAIVGDPGGVLFYHAGALLAVAATACAVWRHGLRTEWTWLFVGLALFEVGDALWDGLRLLHHDDGPTVSVADVIWVAGYVAYAFGIGQLLRRRNLATRTGLLDGAILAGATSTALWHTVLSPSAISTGSLIEKVLAVGYPVLDLLLLAAALWVAVGGNKREPAVRLLAAHLGLLAVADLVWVAVAIDGILGRLLDATYVPAYALLAAAALHPAANLKAMRGVSEDQRRGRLLLLCGAMLIGPTAAAATNGFDSLGDITFVASAAALAALVAARFVGLVLDAEHARAALEVARDELTAAHASMAEQSLTDPLTGLPNRRALIAHLEALLKSGPTALCFLDLDRFKVFNDSLGHAVGDEVLVGVAERLAHLDGRHGGMCARLGGDEFVLVSPAAHAADAVRLGELIIAALDPPLNVAGTDVFLEASVGAAIGIAGDTPESLLRDADIAMYSAKADGRNRVALFDARMRSAAARRFVTESALRTAIPDRELVLHYQPIVDPTTGVLHGVEALLRWNHNDRLLLPCDFLETAEETGLIVEIGEWVVNEACRQLVAWDETENEPPPRMFVNVSARQLRSPRLPHAITTALATTGIAPERLTLEINESAVMGDPTIAEIALTELRELGVRLAIDDFGTGFSSLAHLHRLPLHVVKLDRTFANDLLSKGDDSVVVTSLVQLVHGLGRDVIIEGIEDAAQLVAAADAGADWVQGYHLGRPVAPEAIPAVVRRMRNLHRVTALVPLHSVASEYGN